MPRGSSQHPTEGARPPPVWTISGFQPDSRRVSPAGAGRKPTRNDKVPPNPTRDRSTGGVTPPALVGCERTFPTLPPPSVRGGRAVSHVEDVTTDLAAPGWRISCLAVCSVIVIAVAVYRSDRTTACVDPQPAAITTNCPALGKARGDETHARAGRIDRYILPAVVRPIYRWISICRGSRSPR